MDYSHKLITLIIILILTANLVVALGVNSPYWNGNPLKISSGETREVSFPLVNSINEKTTEATVSLTEGTEIAEIISGEKYTVKPGENDKNIILRITIPENVQLGDSYNVKFVVRYSPQGEGANVKLDVEYNVDFPVEVVSEENATPTMPKYPGITGTEEGKTKTIIIIAMLAIIILIIIIILLKVRKEQQEKIILNR